VGTCYDLYGDNFTYGRGGTGSGFDRSLDSGDITGHDYGNQSAAGLLASDQRDIGGLESRIAGLDRCH
jgi:hypothetical protein